MSPRHPAGAHPARGSRALWVGLGLLAAAGTGVAALLLRGVAPDGSVPVIRDGRLWRLAGGRFAGDAACAPCHQREMDAHADSAHARTVQAVGGRMESAEGVNGQAVTDPLTGATYTMVGGAGGLRLQLASNGAEVEAPARWRFGSGAHAHGYLLEFEKQVVDCRINWYRSINGWDFASGQDKPTRTLLEQPLGRPLPPDEVARCFSCHSTQLWAKGADAAGVPGQQLQLNLSRTVVNVGCEGCHGPRAEHVTMARTGRLERVPPMTPEAMNAMCGRCHSQEDLRPDHEVIARFQPWGLARSRCFRESEGRLSCKSCHDPHRDAVRDVTFYEAKCRGCHAGTRAPGGPKRTACPVNPTAGCVPCHMRRDSEAMLHMTFTDHQIRILAAAGGKR